jgi:hypothetical protein
MKEDADVFVRKGRAERELFSSEEFRYVWDPRPGTPLAS